MAEPRFRQALPQDAARCHRIESAAYEGDEAFKELVGHDPAAPNAVILSVAIDPRWQGQGLATPMMRTFVAAMRRAGKTAIHLLCKQRHVALYERLGYRYVRPSASTHGGMAWHEMVMGL